MVSEVLFEEEMALTPPTARKHLIAVLAWTLGMAAAVGLLTVIYVAAVIAFRDVILLGE